MNPFPWFLQHLSLSVALILLLFSGCSFSNFAGNETEFLEAILAYEEADQKLSQQSSVMLDISEGERLAQKRIVQNEFRRVASMYQGLLDRGIESGAILYNQGNAWYRSGEPAYAIVAYRKAGRYLPNNPYLLANLKTVSISRNPAERSTFWTTLFFWQNLISYPHKFYLSLVASLFAFVAGMIALFRREKMYLKLATFLTATACLAIASATYDWYRFDCTEYGVVLADQTVPRKGNSSHYDPAFTEPVPKRTEFTVSDKRGQWILAKFAEGESGWIPIGDTVIY